MLEGFWEWLASRSTPRFARYRAARLAYEAYLVDHRVSFEALTAADFRRAAADDRLREAEVLYGEAIELSRREWAAPDVAVALYQLGMLLHLRGRFDEALVPLEEALGTFESIPGADQSARSGCYYHLGLLALRWGDVVKARCLLHRSLEIDEALGDLGGASFNRTALAKCDEVERRGWPAGDAAEGECPPAPPIPAPFPARPGGADDPPGRSPRPDDGPTAETGTAPANGITAGFTTGPPPAADRFTDADDVLWLLSHSEEANDEFLRPLEESAGALGRRVLVVRAAFGSEDPDRASLPPLTHDQRLCGAVLVLEPGGLANEDFRYWARWCVGAVAGRSDFRLFVCRKGITEAELERRTAAGDDTLKPLLDTIQRTVAGANEVARAVGDYLGHLAGIRAAAAWRRLRIRAATAVGATAGVMQAASILLALGALTAVVLVGKESGAHRLVGGHAAPVSTAAGIAFFRFLTPTLYLLARGRRAIVLLERTPRFAWLCRWSSVLAVLVGVLPTRLGDGAAWFWLGATAGVLLDLARRNMRGAQRAAFPLQAAWKIGQERLPEPLLEATGGDAPVALRCPLFQAAGPRVFISYARKSAWGAATAERLHAIMEAQGTEVFFDRKCIGEGSSWRNELHERLAEVNVVIALIDEVTWDRPWVAAELVTALEGRRLTGIPEIIVVRGPTVPAPVGAGPLPVFSALLDAGTVPQEGRPQVVRASDATLPGLAAALLPHRFHSHGVLHPLLVYLLSILASPAVAVGTLGTLFGLLGALFAYLEYWDRFRLSSTFASRGLLPTAFLLGCYWLGFVLRLWPASRYEMGPEMIGAAGLNLMAAIGFTGLLAVWWPQVSPLIAAWGLVLTGAGWSLAKHFVESVGPERRGRLRGRAPLP